MKSGILTALLAGLKPRQHRGIKSFDQELRAAGGVASVVDSGIRAVPTDKIVGSVSRWRELGSNFFYRTGKGVTARYERVRAAMRRGVDLPPIEVYRLTKRTSDKLSRPARSEYYVVDGHHRVAIARELGQEFLDAHVVSYTAATASAGSSQVAPPEEAVSDQAGSQSSAPPPHEPSPLG